jgi:hypothetical protein
MVEPKCGITNFIFAANDDNENALQASYRVTTANFIAESVIDPCVKDVVKCLLGENAAQKVDMLPLLNNIVPSRVDGMSNNIYRSNNHGTT